MKYFFVLIFPIAVFGNETDARISDLEKRVEGLQKALIEVYKSSGESDRKIMMKIADLHRKDRPAECDFFNPGLDSCRDFNGFIFYVLPEKIETEGGGIRLTFSIGNPYAGEFGPVNLWIRYSALGKPLAKNVAPEHVVEQWERMERETMEWRASFKLAPGKQESLAASAWTRASVFIPGVSLADFKSVEIVVDPSGVRLNKAR